jgi:hypothetical protein
MISLKTQVISIDIMDKCVEPFKKNIIRYPRLDTVIMVEEAIKNSKNYPKKTMLWKNLPKKVMYQTFNTILDYLEYSGKIHITKNREIIWTHNPKLVSKYLEKKELSWRKEDETKHNQIC